MAHPIPTADVASSLEAFLDAAGEFFSSLAAIGWGSLAAALVFYLGMLLARTRAWRNALRAAYPEAGISYWRVTAAYLSGAGINSIFPARAGDVVKVFLARNQVEGSSYTTVASSFMVEGVFDITAGLLVLAFALSQGLLPQPPDLPTLPAFEVSFWADHPRFLLFFLTVLGVSFVAAFALLVKRVELFWRRVKQGLAILTDRRRYLREVAAWQAAGWLCRFGAFWLFLEAFNVGGSVHNVLLVMSVQAIATLLPFTPGGAGAQQALLVATLTGPSASTVLAYSVGQQIAIAAWAAALGFGSLVVVFRRTDWRALIAEGRAAQSEAEGVTV